MNSQIRYDINRFPNLFWLSNPLSAEELVRACDLWPVPGDLLAFWREFGTGDMFESESILRPFSPSSSVEFITQRERDKGLPPDMTVFHLGISVSGFTESGFEAFERESYRTLGVFKSLDEWYVEIVRGSFDDRYEL